MITCCSDPFYPQTKKLELFFGPFILSYVNVGFLLGYLKYEHSLQVLSCKTLIKAYFTNEGKVAPENKVTVSQL